jgi:hypothetical protein
MIPLGLEDNGRVEWIPDREAVEVAKNHLKTRGVRVIG